MQTRCAGALFNEAELNALQFLDVCNVRGRAGKAELVAATARPWRRAGGKEPEARKDAAQRRLRKSGFSRLTQPIKTGVPTMYELRSGRWHSLRIG